MFTLSRTCFNVPVGVWTWSSLKTDVFYQSFLERVQKSSSLPQRDTFQIFSTCDTLLEKHQTESDLGLSGSAICHVAGCSNWEQSLPRTTACVNDWQQPGALEERFYETWEHEDRGTGSLYLGHEYIFIYWSVITEILPCCLYWACMYSTVRTCVVLQNKSPVPPVANVGKQQAGY